MFSVPVSLWTWNSSAVKAPLKPCLFSLRGLVGPFMCTSRAWVGQHGQSVSLAKCYLVNWLWTGSKRMIGSCSDVHLWLQIVFSWQNLSPFLHKNLPIKYIQQQISNQQQQIWSNGNGRRQIDSSLAQWRKGRRGGPSQAIPLDMPLLSLCLSFGLSPSFPLYPLSPGSNCMWHLEIPPFVREWQTQNKTRGKIIMSTKLKYSREQCSGLSLPRLRRI